LGSSLSVARELAAQRELTKIIQECDAWVVSPMGPVLRFETRRGHSELPDTLKAAGHAVAQVGSGERWGPFAEEITKNAQGNIVNRNIQTVAIPTDVWTVEVVKQEPKPTAPPTTNGNKREERQKITK
jgi:hypothetical protein